MCKKLMEPSMKTFELDKIFSQIIDNHLDILSSCACVASLAASSCIAYKLTVVVIFFRYQNKFYLLSSGTFIFWVVKFDCMAAWRLMGRVLQVLSWVATALTFSRYTFCPLQVAVSQNMRWGPYEEILTSLPFLYIIWLHSFASVSASALGYDIVLSLSSSYKAIWVFLSCTNSPYK